LLTHYCQWTTWTTDKMHAQFTILEFLAAGWPRFKWNFTIWNLSQSACSSSMCETLNGKCEIFFNKYSYFLNSCKYLHEFHLIRQNSWLQNLHHNTNFYESIHNCSYSYLTFVTFYIVTQIFVIFRYYQYTSVMFRK
jgi:hypothetical protein